MHNFWFALDTAASLASFQTFFKLDQANQNTVFSKNEVAPRKVNLTWFPAQPRPEKPFARLSLALGRAVQRHAVQALFYESQRQPLPPPGLTRLVPTLVALNAAFWPSTVYANTAVAGFVVDSVWAQTALVQQTGISAERVLVMRRDLDLAHWDAQRQTYEQACAHKSGLPERVRILFDAEDFENHGGQMLLDLLRCIPRLAASCEVQLVTRKQTPPYLYRAHYPDHWQLKVYPRLHSAPAEFYFKADIFVLPSRKPVSSALIAKALAAGLPVIASKVGGLPELVRDGSNGLLIPPGDCHALAQALFRLIENPVLRHTLGQAARRTAEIEFDRAANSRKIVNYLKLIST